MMKKSTALLLSLLSTTAAFGADNAVIVTPGSGVTMKSKDVGAGVQAMQPIPSDITGTPVAVPDNTNTFTFGTSPFLIMGGSYNSSPGTLTSGRSGAVALTSTRSMHVLDDNSASLLAAAQAPIPAGTNTIGIVNANILAGTSTIGVVTANVAASENHIGEVAGNVIPITVALTTSSVAVTTGKSIGGTITFANAVRVSGAVGSAGTGGILQNLSVFFKDPVGGTSADLYLYNAAPSSSCVDNGTFTLSTSDVAKVIAVVHITDFTASNTAVIAQANNLAISFGLASSTSMFGCLVARGTFTLSTTSAVDIIANVLRQ